MHGFINEGSFSLTHHTEQSVDIFYFLFGATPFLWIKWHKWHLKVVDLDKPCPGHTDCAWESCHLMHNTNELWALECETSQPWITGLIILHKMKAALAALSQTSWRGMAWAGYLTTRQHLCAHQDATESQRKEGSVLDRTHKITEQAQKQMFRWKIQYWLVDSSQCMHVQTWACKIRLDIDKGGSEHKWDKQT